jgi:hypothetical protein
MAKASDANDDSDPERNEYIFEHVIGTPIVQRPFKGFILVYERISNEVFDVREPGLI